MREVTAPTFEPLTLQEVRVHLRQAGDGDSPGDSPAFIEDTLDDSWVTAKITTARQFAEDFLGYPLTDAVYVQGFDTFTGDSVSGFGCLHDYVHHMVPGLLLPMGAVEIVAVQYLDVDNALMTVPPSAYSFDEFSRRLYLDEEPIISGVRSKPVRIQFKGAFTAGDSGASPPVLPYLVPENIKHAMLLLIGHWYENREGTVIGPTGVNELPLGVEALLRPQRTRLGMA